MRNSTPVSGLANARLARRVGLAIVGLLIASLAGEALAQNLATGRGRLRGRIADTAGNPVGGAQVTFVYVATGEAFDADSDDDGVFVKGNMGFGAWRVDVVAAGYEDYSRMIQLRNVGRDYRMEVVMTPGTSGGSGGSELTSLFTGELGDRLTELGALFDGGDYAGALAGYEGLIAEEAAKDDPNPEIHYVHLNAGNAAAEMNDHAKAEMHYQALLAEVPDNLDARLGLAGSYMVQRRTDDAIAALDGVDLSGVMDPFVFYNVGQMFFEQGQSAEAESYYRMSVERDPAFADGYMQLGLSLIQQGKMQDAKPHLEKVLELDPGSENAALAEQFLQMVDG